MNCKISKWIVLGFVILIAGSVCYRIISAEGELTGGEFVIKLVKSMGLDYKLEEDATMDNYVNLLTEEGFVLPEGFGATKPITREQRAELLSQVLNLGELKREQAKMDVYRNKAVIKEIEGTVMVKREGTAEWIPAELEMKLTEGDYIKTESNSRTLLRVGVAGKIEIKENSELLLRTIATQNDKKSENILLYLALGEMTVDVRYIHKNTIFETHTSTTVAAVRGTIYIIKVKPIDGKTEIR